MSESTELMVSGTKVEKQGASLSKWTGGVGKILSSSRFVSLISVTIALLVWQFIISRVIPPLYFPSLKATVQAYVTLIKNGTLLVHVWTTTYRTIFGFLWGTFVGIAIGVAMSWNKKIEAALDPFIEILRPIPALALIPFFILWFGIGDQAKILFVGWAAVVVMIVNTVEGIKNVPPIYLNAAIILGANKKSLYRTVILPAILPHLVGGFRVSLALSWGMIIAAEFMGAKSGLGYLIMLARRTIQTNALLLGVLTIGALSFSTDRIIRMIGRQVTHWLPRAEQPQR